MKLLADVGLVGYPSVGKSSIIAQVSAARPEIAAYHFTTLTPVLGVVRIELNAALFLLIFPDLSRERMKVLAWVTTSASCRTYESTAACFGCSGTDGRDPIEGF